MAESAVFPQLLADVLGEPVRVHRNGTATGAAALATTPANELAGRCADLATSGASVEPGPALAGVRGVVRALAAPS